MIEEVKAEVKRKWYDFANWFDSLTPLEQDIFLTAVGAVATLILAYALRKTRG